MITDNEYFMGIAAAISLKSKDTSTKVGCLIIDENKRIISAGYNGMVAGCEEAELWEPRDVKLATVIHAELNAIIYANRSLKKHVLYCTHSPCVNCLKHVLQSGIRTVYYSDSSIMRRTPINDNEAILKLIRATKADLISTTNGMKYEEEINQWKFDIINKAKTEA